ncbi:MAG: hypothetical protein E6G31_01970 [Actinobacteria bacterium]|nr:MAG: hypothetical protein E6G31_01970 [Actinomycetota bacterium]
MIPSIAVAIAVLALAACGGGGSKSKSSSASTLPQGTKPVQLDPADFTTNIDNPYWPMRPGSHWVYREVENGEAQRVDVTVTNRTKTLHGIEARVVHDRVSQHGETVEDTYDWYAQDSAGNLWYLGEDTAEYENGKLKTKEGSWAYGVDGAQPGVVVPASPKRGMSYREEYYAGHAEDAAAVLNIGSQVQVPFGRFQNALLTRNFSTIEPTVEEMKLYAKGVGPVMELLVSGGSGRTELLSYTKG